MSVPLVLSLWQPWATLVVEPDPGKNYQAAPKEVETRHWDPRPRLRAHGLALPVTLAIHAAKKYDRETRDYYTQWPFREALHRIGYSDGDPRQVWLEACPRGLIRLRSVPLGAIVGLVDLHDVWTTETWLAQASQYKDGSAEDYSRAAEYQMGDFSPGRFAWRLDRPRPLPEPIPFRGRQDVLYPVPDDVLRQIEQQIGSAVR